MERWSPPVKLSRQEQSLMKRLIRVRALFGFLRLHRHELFDETFQEQLEGMYRTTGAGEPPHPPALMCMITLLQGYVGASDAEAVELSVVDLRWQMVLGCLGAATPPFSQGRAAGVSRADGRARDGPSAAGADRGARSVRRQDGGREACGVESAARGDR
ncbi:transposase [Sorangium sp. So ce388]